MTTMLDALLLHDELAVAATPDPLPRLALFGSMALHVAVVLFFYNPLTPPAEAIAEERAFEFTVELSVPLPEPRGDLAETADPAVLPDPPLPPEMKLPEFPPAPRLEQAIAEPEPAPQLAMNEFPRSASVAPARPIARPQPAPQAQLARQTGSEPGEPALRRATEDYLWQVIRKLAKGPNIMPGGQPVESGMVVARLIVARDGRLLGASISQSSRFPVLDRSVLEAVQRAAPFPRLPAAITDDPYSFFLPINFTRTP